MQLPEKLNRIIQDYEDGKVSVEQATKQLHFYFDNLFLRVEKQDGRMARNKARGVASRFGEEID